MRYLLLALLLLVQIPRPAHAYRDAYADAVIVAYQLGKPMPLGGYERWAYSYKQLRVVYAQNGNQAYARVRCYGQIVGKWTAYRMKGGWVVQERIYRGSSCWGLLAQIAAVVRV